MSAWSIAFAAVGLAVLLAAAFWSVHLRRTALRLDRMLEQAIAGSFLNRTDSESLVSQLEHKMARFLTQSNSTTGALAEERARVQALIGDISHQTKTPLANILLYTQLLDEQELPDEARPLCTFIGSQAEKLQFLIGSLVKASRLESGSIQVRPAYNSIQELFTALEKQFRPAAEEKSIALQVAASDLTARFDSRWTLEAVGNLVDNAIKYTPPGGTVTVEAEDYPMFCQIKVSDDGPGIPETEHASVFERFYRGRDAAAEGVGLGLYLARQIITAQEGYIRLRSEPGKGATFSVFLERAQPQLR